MELTSVNGKKAGTQFSPPQSMGIIKNPPHSMGTKKSTPLRGALFSTCLTGISTLRQIIFLQKNKKIICKVLKTI